MWILRCGYILDDKAYDFANLDPEILNDSYGSGLSELQTGTFNGSDCIIYKGNYTDTDANWQLLLIKNMILKQV